MLRRRSLMGGSKDYIPFANSNLNAYFAKTYGDGIGITFEEAAAITEFEDDFHPDKLIKSTYSAPGSFEELNYFTGLKSLPDQFINYYWGAARNYITITNLTLPNLESVGVDCFSGSYLSGTINCPKLKTAGEWAFQWTKVEQAYFGSEFQTYPEGLFYCLRERDLYLKFENLQTINDPYFYYAEDNYHYVDIYLYNTDSCATFGVDFVDKGNYKTHCYLYVRSKFLTDYNNDANWADNCNIDNIYNM